MFSPCRRRSAGHRSRRIASRSRTFSAWRGGSDRGEGRITGARGGWMILVFDVGNSETTIGLFNAEVLRGHWRIMTGVARTADEYGVLIASLLERGGFDLKSVDGVAIGSVVPSVTAPLVQGCARYLPV